MPGRGNDNRTTGEKIGFQFKGEPRPGQVKVFNETVSFLKKGESGIVEAYTGFGKTVLGCWAIAQVGEEEVVVTKDDLMEAGEEGWVNHCLLGLRRDEIGIIRQGKCEVAGKKLVVAMINSLCIEGKYPDWIRDAFGMVIFDECHRVPADAFNAVASMFSARLRLGLSATPERPDGKDA